MKIDAKKKLEEIATRNGGLLRPEDVLAEAADPESPLHSEFPENAWIDSEAAHQYRLECARNVITRVRVEIVPPGSTEPVTIRAYTSLGSDRVGGAGYRPTVQVLNNAGQRAEMLRTALRELQALRTKYSHLSELVSVFDALELAQRQGTGSDG